MTKFAPELAEANAYLAAHPDIQAIELVLTDMNGIARGKRVPPKDLDKVFRNGTPLIGSIFALDTRGENINQAGMALSSGDPDQIMVPVSGQLLPMPWSKEPVHALLMTMQDKDGTPYFADPRAILARVLKSFEPLGITPVVACELEFYLIAPDHGPDGAPLPPVSPLTGRREGGTGTYSLDDLQSFSEFLSGVDKACRAQGIPTSAALSEYAPGQFEINLEHGPDALKAADHAALFKRTCRAVARAQGHDVSFMAKPYPATSGSGLHIHVSLADRNGKALFAADEGMLHQALGGLIAALPESVALLAPNANSYRRLAPGSYAPTVASWGYDNRNVALRVVGSGGDLRIEHRLAGADANPYLVMAAVLAGIHHGIQNALDSGPEAVPGTDTDVSDLPLRWADAIDRFEKGTILPAYLGAAYHKLFATCRRGELERFEADADSREWRWYLATV